MLLMRFTCCMCRMSVWNLCQIGIMSIPNGHMSDWNLRPFQMDICQIGIYVHSEWTHMSDWNVRNIVCPSCSIAHVKSSVCRVDIVHQLGTRLSSGLLYKMPIMTINYIFAVVISQCKLRLIPKTAFAYVKH